MASLLDAGSIPAASRGTLCLSENGMRNTLLSLLLILTLLPTAVFPLSVQFRSFDHPGYTRFVLESDSPVAYKYRTEDRVIVVDIQGEIKEGPRTVPIAKSSLIDHLVTSRVDGRSRFEIHLREAARIKSHFVLEKPHRIVFDLVNVPKSVQTEPQKPVKPEHAPAKTEEQPQVAIPEVQETPNQEADQMEQAPEQELKTPYSAVVMRPIETVCIDPGHGGSDMGAVAEGGVFEKDIVLNISKHLRELLVRRLGLRVMMTREGDEEVSLNSRVAKANNEKAQLFVSIHLNSDYRRSARGPETFYVSLKATDREAAELAKKENASYEEIEQIADSSDLKMILWNMAQNEYIQESSQLAVEIQEELNELLSTRNRGVKQAPFRVLMRAAMPAVLVEIAFLSNPGEAQRLKSDSFQMEAALAVFRGINRFVTRYNSMVTE